MSPLNLSLVRWAGGKGRQLEQLLPLIPRSRIYVEPFGGGGVVLLNRERSEVEVYNDLDHQLYNLFRVVRDKVLFEDFANKLQWTLYSKQFFVDSLNLDIDDRLFMVEAAVKFYTMLNQGISGKRLASAGDWATGKVDNLADRWVLRQQKLGFVRDRLQGVQVECRDALEVLGKWDSPATTFYCDPPYVLETRNGKQYYAVESDDDFHRRLVDTLTGLEGAVVLSGYRHPLYDRLQDCGWSAESYGTTALMTVHDEGEERAERLEVVWRNPKACNQLALF